MQNGTKDINCPISDYTMLNFKRLYKNEDFFKKKSLIPKMVNIKTKTKRIMRTFCKFGLIKSKAIL
jgi:hypothetical protein